MNDYNVYFEVYGKKLRTTVQAIDEFDAINKVKSSVEIVKVKIVDENQPIQPEYDESKSPYGNIDGADFFDDLLNLFVKKK